MRFDPKLERYRYNTDLVPRNEPGNHPVSSSFPALTARRLQSSPTTGPRAGGNMSALLHTRPRHSRSPVPSAWEYKTNALPTGWKCVTSKTCFGRRKNAWCSFIRRNRITSTVILTFCIYGAGGMATFPARQAIWSGRWRPRNLLREGTPFRKPDFRPVGAATRPGFIERVSLTRDRTAVQTTRRRAPVPRACLRVERQRQAQISRTRLRGGALHHPHSDGFGFGKNHV